MIFFRIFALLVVGVVLATFTVTKAGATCLDSAPVGDGWGWDGSASCRIDVREINTNASCTDTPPVGDGWGWDGSASCRIDVREINTNASCTDTPPVGDGWGWDGSVSCRIHVREINPDVSCTDTPPLGDGWGWDGSQSCRLISNQAARAIMPVGDSITHGAKGYKSYRYHLLSMLEQENCSFTMVGSQLENEVTTGFTSPHESYSTMKADHFLTGYSTWSGDNQGIQSAMAQFVPDVVLLHIGSNDVYFHESTESTAAEINQMIAIIKTVNPNSTVLVSNIIPWFARSDDNRLIVEDSRQLGNAISKLVDSFNDDSIVFVDVFTGYTRDMMISDLIHPNVIGEQHIARAFFSAYLSAGLCW